MRLLFEGCIKNRSFRAKALKPFFFGVERGVMRDENKVDLEL